jgi:hypothetical protein
MMAQGTVTLMRVWTTTEGTAFKIANEMKGGTMKEVGSRRQEEDRQGHEVVQYRCIRYCEKSSAM